MTTGYFGLEMGSAAEAHATAEHVSRESGTVWLVVELTYPDGKVVHTTWTPKTYWNTPRSTIGIRAVQAYLNGEQVGTEFI
jgi:hypothetical protein